MNTRDESKNKEQITTPDTARGRLVDLLSSEEAGRIDIEFDRLPDEPFRDPFNSSDE